MLPEIMIDVADKWKAKVLDRMGTEVKVLLSSKLVKIGGYRFGRKRCQFSRLPKG